MYGIFREFWHAVFSYGRGESDRQTTDTLIAILRTAREGRSNNKENWSVLRGKLLRYSVTSHWLSGLHICFTAARVRHSILANLVFNSRSRSLYAIARPSVVCLSSVTFVRPTQAFELFGNISMALGTLATHWHPPKILRRSSQGNPFVGGVKHNRGSQI